MAFLDIGNTMGSDTPGKAKSKRKREPFRLKASRYSPPLFLIPKSKRARSSRNTKVLNPEYVLPTIPPSTTKRGADGMSFIW